MRRKKTTSRALIALFLILFCGLLVITARTPGEVGEDYVSFAYSTILSLLPPVVAISLALLTKEVYSSLFIGTAVGALLYAGGNLELALNTMLYHPDGGFVVNLTDISHAGILVFVIILGSMVVLMNKSGSAAAFGQWASKRIKSRVGAQLATMLLGMLIFVDDGFNCMTVGSVMRPITDRHHVSRAKLAYLIDATAAPICIIAPISSWAAAVTFAVPDSMEINGFIMFLRTIPYNLYALGTLWMLLWLTLFRIDYGKMKEHEDNALKGDLFTSGEKPYDEQDVSDEVERARVSNLAIPVVTLIVCCIIGMVYTGGFFSGVSFIDAFADADSARGLVTGSLVALLVTFILYMWRGVLSFEEFMSALPAGFRSMCAPMIILILSWNLSGMTGLLGAGDFIHNVVNASASSFTLFLPAIVFVVSVFLAFATGTSWGTFTILIPIVCTVFPDEGEMLVISIAACLAGAVCGDHCSPISDTTIMASAGAHCNHVNHVTTQLPYALTVAAVCTIGYLIAGAIGYATNGPLALIATPIMLALQFAALLVVKNRSAGTAS